ncbi:calcineurin-like phosphoesterase [Thraustotheca clavata]|uniref:Calcineurin-like phosphoesterase n=1 Tax=Thraustotheca clavata TaxID=74557 RepID=A0A1V9ZEN2_9STRA|nr:calcineurin-like phosphoesterase [Thraustotheca clavata]
MRVVCISDTHNKHYQLEVPDGDILIHAGDFTSCGTHNEIRNFTEWLGRLPHRHKLVIAGNHELTLDTKWYKEAGKNFHPMNQDSEIAKQLLQNCTYLENQAIEIDGVHFYGSPYSPIIPSNPMAFSTLAGSHAKAIWNQIPENTDVLITHSPPHGILDINVRGYHCGDEDLLEIIQSRVRPKYHIFGHIHECYGSKTIDTTTFINAASLSQRRKCENKPIVFDI